MKAFSYGLGRWIRPELADRPNDTAFGIDVDALVVWAGQVQHEWLS